jgi:hypothetical protein
MYYPAMDVIVNREIRRDGGEFILTLSEQSVIDVLDKDPATVRAAMNIVSLVLDVYGVEWENAPKENRYAILLAASEIIKLEKKKNDNSEQSV